ncbi:hypothetical protein CASFOL_012724 [Castilleja foliolosa]|uniref:J domain-containing protein n=1 Tax=Castilleja foliolosa TaxID=1961234 RepID=A0ABD3DJ70_9LAMI
MVLNEPEKSQLATEICDISTHAIACAKFHHANFRKTPFINWYLVLRVNENADIYVIRKQYHKLALQLHPDKNKHSKAETAFKLVSEAYFCLSDSAKRATFDSQRQNISCTKCNNTTTNITKIRKTLHQETTTTISNLRLKELRNKLKDEANIIEKCLAANATASRRPIEKFGNRTKTELPVFNPSDYYQYNGTPQNRTINHRQMEDLRACFRMGNRCLNDRVSMNSSPVFQCRSERVSINNSPVFQYRSERVSFMSSCASTRAMIGTKNQN